MTNPTKLWFLNGNKVIMAVQVGNATRYYGKVNPFFYAAVIVELAIGAGFGYHFNTVVCRFCRLGLFSFYQENS